MLRLVLLCLLACLAACTAPGLVPLPPPGPGLVLGPSAGSWDSAQLLGPRVVRGDDGTWRMWYSGRDPDFPVPAALPAGRIGLATSRDGRRWDRVTGPGTLGSVLEPTVDPDRFDTGHIAVSDVQWQDGRYFLWYFGGRPGEFRLAGRRYAGLPMGAVRAVSLDGVRWQRDSGPHEGALLAPGPAGSADAGLVGWPQAVPAGNGRVHLYYSALDAAGTSRVHLALSMDGRRFARVGPVLGPGDAGIPDSIPEVNERFDSTGAGEAQVLRRPDGWWMFYAGTGNDGRKAIGLAHSADGRTWTRVPGPGGGGAILEPASGPGAWDGGSVGTPWVVSLPNGELHLYYTGTSGDIRSGIRGRLGRGPLPRHQLGLARSSGDLTRWERVALLP